MKVIDLMAGIGGRSIAFKNAGFQIVCAIESHRENADTYCNIVQPNDFRQEHIIDVDPETLPDADMISGKLSNGFSRAGRRDAEPWNPENDAVYRIIACKCPLFFLLEAPVGILMQSNRKNLEAILDKYVHLGYHVMYHIFKESEYSGYPMAGKQLYFVGIRGDLSGREFYFPEPEFSGYERECWEEPEVNEWYRKVPAELEMRDYEKGKFYLLERGILKETNQILMGLYREMYRVDDVGFRKFTHNELAALKGFHNYNFNKCANKRSMYKNIAYASNVSVVEAIARELADYAGEKVWEKLPVEKAEKKKRKQKKPEQTGVVFPKQKLTGIHIDKLKGLKNLDLSINRNLTAIMGVNGSGKSTILQNALFGIPILWELKHVFRK